MQKEHVERLVNHIKDLYALLDSANIEHVRLV